MPLKAGMLILKPKLIVMKQPVELIPINKVLLVDDDIAANYLSKELLEKLHVAKEIDIAENGSVAFTLITQKECPDVIFLDIKMPQMDGFDFLECLQNMDLPKNVKVIMLTSSVRPEDREKALSYKGVVDYFEKPLTPEKLQMAIVTYLN
jgi:CheY-like chemotaxis protein